jgi:hypothetical protein
VGIYYADIDDSYNTDGHLGTTGDPFSFNDLQGHSNTNPSGNTYNIKGITLQNPGDANLNINLNDNIWQGWDLTTNGPWRVGYVSADPSDNNSIVIPGINGIIKDAIIYNSNSAASNSNIDRIHHAVNSIFITSSGYLNLDYSPLEPASFYGCTFYGGVRDSGGGNPTFTDCLISAISQDGSPWVFNNCALVDGDLGYVYNNCQLNWTMPLAPVWNGPRSDFDNDILAAGVLSGPGNPEPGAGYPLYTDYPTGLWGTPRLGIGAVDFASSPTTSAPTTSSPTTTSSPVIFYANINDDYLGTDHEGTEIDPFSYSDLLVNSYIYSGVTFEIWGIRHLDSAVDVSLNVNSNMWNSYNLPDNGPWRIGNAGVGSILFNQTGSSEIHNSIIYSSSGIADIGICYDVVLIASDINVSNSTLNACTVYGNMHL